MIRKSGTLGVLLLALMLAAVPAYSQLRGRQDVDDLARDLSTQAGRIWQTVQADLDAANPSAVRGPRGMELYMALSNFSNSARVYAELAGRYRNDNVLRGGARSLVEQARAIDVLMDRTGALQDLRDEWTRASVLAADLGDIYNLQYASRRELPRVYEREREYPGYRSGTFTWQGQVDGSDHIKLRGSRVIIEHLAANPIQNASYNLPSPLPRAAVDVELTKIRGRGRVVLAEQPSAANGFTAVVLIDDPQGGPDFYEFELSW